MGLSTGEATLAVIADDLTGAADTGVQLAKRGLHTVLLPFRLDRSGASHYLREARVIAINTATRGVESKQAYDTVRSATALLMQTLHPQIIYKKVDSTLRGNLGAEIEAVMDATGSEFAVLAPAFPAYGRTTSGGAHFVNGQPLAQTEAAGDPVCPVRESHIPTLLQSQTELSVGHIDLETVRSRSLQHIIQKHVKGGERIIVFDAVTDDDLNSIVKAGMLMSPPPLMAGSAGLANQLSGLSLFRGAGQVPARASGEGVVIVISGSLSAVTSKQLERVRKAGMGDVVRVEMPGDESEWGRQIIPGIVSAAKTNRVVGIQSVQRKLCDSQCSPLLVMESLGRLARQIVENCPRPVRGLILTGGDTALAVFQELGIAAVRLIDEILPGIPYSRVINGEFANLYIVTKAGAFGDENALVRCIDFL